MVKKISNSARVALAFSSVALLVAGNGCSRMMSPPGQRLFGQNTMDVQDWDGAASERTRPEDPSQLASRYRDGIDNREMGNREMSGNPLGATGPVAEMNGPSLTPEGALEQQFAHSMKVPEKIPPRLIPIESVRFPGDDRQVVTASATLTDEPSSRAALAVALSDRNSSSQSNSDVQQAVVLSDSNPSTMTPPASATKVAKENLTDSVPSDQKVELPTEPRTQRRSQTRVEPGSSDANQTGVRTSKLAVPPPTRTQADYNRALEKVQTGAKDQTFKPDQFQAGRRSGMQPSSPSDRKDSAASMTAVATNVAPVASGAVNPAKPSDIMDPSSAAARPSTPVTLAAVKGKSEPQSGRDNAATADTPATTETTASPTSNPLKEFTRRSASLSLPESSQPSSNLSAAGIKVDASAFNTSVPTQKPKPTPTPIQPASVDKPAKPAAGANPPATIPDKHKPVGQPSAVAPAKLETPTSPNGAFVPGSNPAPKGASSPTRPPSDASKSTSTFVPFPGPAKSDRNASSQSSISNSTVSGNPTGSVAKPSSSSPSSPPNPKTDSAKVELASTESASPLSASAIPSTIDQPQSKQNLATNSTLAKPLAGSERKLSLAESGLNLSKPLNQPKPLSMPAASAIPSQFSAQAPQPARHVEKIKPASPRLELVNSQFCTEIKGFGQVTPFSSTRFKGNQRTLVYCEVENYQSQTKQTDQGTQYVTRFRGDYQIVDHQGAVVQKGQFPEIEDITIRKRRDFYLYFPINFKNLPAGSYQLKLAIEESMPATAEDPSTPVARQTLSFSVE